MNKYSLKNNQKKRGRYTHINIGTSVHGMLKPNIPTWREKKNYLLLLTERVCSSPIGGVDPEVPSRLELRL